MTQVCRSFCRSMEIDEILHCNCGAQPRRARAEFHGKRCCASRCAAPTSLLDGGEQVWGKHAGGADRGGRQRALDEGLREVNPIMRPFVTRGAAGEAAGSALGFGVGVGFVYMLHRTHHYKAERLAMRLIMVDEAGAVVNNIVAIR
jgi:hypothetical protein